MKYKLVIWDIDGTLLDTSIGLLDAYKYTIKFLKLPEKSDQEILSYIGPTPQNIFKKYFNMNDKDAQIATDIFREHYKTHDLFKASVYDGIYDIMESLKKNKVKQAIATNKRQDYAIDICKHFNFDKYCFPIYGSDNFNKTTKAESILKCLKTLNITNLSCAIMIGDTEQDQIAAKTAGIDFLGINYGFGFKNCVYVKTVKTKGN